MTPLFNDKIIFTNTNICHNMPNAGKITYKKIKAMVIAVSCVTLLGATHTGHLV